MGSVYEADNGEFLRSSRKAGGRLVPGTRRPLFPVDLRATTGAIGDNRIFITHGRKPLRARRGSSEKVIGYKFSNEQVVVFRAQKWNQFDFPDIDFHDLAESMEKAGKFNKKELEAVARMLRIEGITFNTLVRDLRDALKVRTEIGVTPTKVEESEVAFTVVTALIRGAAIQVLMRRNVEISSEMFTAAEKVQASMNILLDELRSTSIDFY